jgi:ABC-type transport system substrate-binding protein
MGQWRNSRPGKLLGAAALGAMLASAAFDGHAQTAERVTVVMDPSAAETNRAWATGGAFDLDAVFQRLIGNDSETGVYDNSALVESWETNDDFTVWTFHLKPDAEWHNGWGKVTSADVAHSYEIQTGPDTLATGIQALRGAEVEIVDDHTIRFVFDEPSMDFDFANAGRGSMYIYSKAQFDEQGMEGYDREPAGTGHFRFVEREPGRVLLETVENHWSGTTPDFGELELRFTLEPATKLAMLLSGEADIAVVPRELLGDAAGAGMEIVTSRQPSKHVVIMPDGLYMKEGDPAFNPELPWTDVRVREAMNRALNRDEIIDVIYGGEAEKLAVYGMHEAHEGFVPELVERFEAEYGYDPERARALLDEAGYPDAFGQPVIPIVSTVSPGSPEYPSLAELIQVYFEEAGFQTEIREMDWASLGALGRGRESYVVHPVQNAPIRPSHVALTNTFLEEGSTYHGYEDDELTALVEEMIRTIDPGKREALIREAFTYAFENYTDMPMVSLSHPVAVNPETIETWIYPGVTSNGLSHWHLIKPAS